MLQPSQGDNFQSWNELALSKEIKTNGTSVLTLKTQQKVAYLAFFWPREKMSAGIWLFQVKYVIWNFGL